MFKNISLYLTVVLKFTQRYLKRLLTPKIPKSTGDYRHKKDALYLHRAHQKIFIFIGVVLFILSLGGQIIEGVLPNQRVSQGIIGLYSQDSLPPQVLSLISKSLVSIDQNGKTTPSIATSWQVNNDATLYTFHLKDNLTWSNQELVKSSDIELKINGAQISYPDDKTIQVKLTDSFSALPSLLNIPILKRGTLIGLGPYTVTTVENNHSAIIKLHLRSLQKTDDLPYLTINFYPDEKTAKISYELGQIDSILGLSDDKEYQNQTHSKIKTFSIHNRLVAIFHNTKDAILSDKNLRKALNAASPKFESEDRAKTIYSQKSWVFNDTLKDPLDNLDLAREYLSKVQSYKNNPITLTTTPNLEVFAAKIIKNWRQIGINAILRVESGVPQNFQALLIIQPIPADPDQYILWHSTQVQTNVSKYSSPRADKDLEDGRKTNDATERKERYLDLQKVIMDDVPLTPLYFAKTNVIYRKRVGESLQKILNLQFPN